ncbi:BON domain-containing protein [Aeromicrobium sp.]|uniref:BON domain-containing protein n=1 Tax=Aeromicrobium sp. TaxID=1871063 RepID=UPI0019B7B72A|nr:BON domain-containing protein [Aeromicrobium sp.]MBC7633589.1 BON domain-containing protein [Aeromicrobium sp.]
MTTPTESQRDHLIKEDVDEELAWAPEVNDSQIGVSVLDGVVTLSGEVDTYAERVDAKDAALRVAGVQVVADDLLIRDVVRNEHTDTDIAVSIRNVIGWSADVPQGAVDVEVLDHVVVLTGEVDWDYQRRAAENLVRGLAGVLRVENRIDLSPRVSASNTANLIKSALVRHALLDSHAITVAAVGSEVTLSGVVTTWAEKEQAAHAAWASPHVTAVHNKLAVRQ